MENMTTDARSEVLTLINKKDKIEQEIREWGQILSQVIMTGQFFYLSFSMKAKY